MLHKVQYPIKFNGTLDFVGQLFGVGPPYIYPHACYQEKLTDSAMGRCPVWDKRRTNSVARINKKLENALFYWPKNSNMVFVIENPHSLRPYLYKNICENEYFGSERGRVDY